MMLIEVLDSICIALWLGAANRAWHLWRDPDDLPLAAVTAGLIALAVGWTMSLQLRGVINGMINGLPKLITDVAVMVTAFCLLAFFSYGVQRGAAVTYIRRQLAILSGVMAMVITAWALASPTVRVAPNALSTIHDGHAFVIDASVDIYSFYALAVALVWSIRYARTAHGALERGLRLLAIGLFGMLVNGAAGAAIRVVGWWVSSRAPIVIHLLTVYLAALIVGTAFFLAGLSYPALAALRAAIPMWRRHWAAYRALTPLWGALIHAFPDLALSRTGGRWDAVRPWPIHRRYYRRVIEIRDGLVWLGPHYPHTDDPTNPQVTVHAPRVAAALRAKAAGAPPASPPYPIPVPATANLAEDAAWLMALSGATVPLLARSAGQEQ